MTYANPVDSVDEPVKLQSRGHRSKSAEGRRLLSLMPSLVGFPCPSGELDWNT